MQIYIIHILIIVIVIRHVNRQPEIWLWKW